MTLWNFDIPSLNAALSAELGGSVLGMAVVDDVGSAPDAVGAGAEDATVTSVAGGGGSVTTDCADVDVGRGTTVTSRTARSANDTPAATVACHRASRRRRRIGVSR